MRLVRNSGKRMPARPPSRARVVSWAWPGEDVECWSLLNDAAAINHRHMIGDGLHHFHLMRDQKDGQTEFLVDLLEQGKD